jgi:hypothetical protein
LLLTLKLDAIKASMEEGPAANVIANLRTLTNEANSAGLKYLASEASLYTAEALIRAKDYARARQELERLLTTCEKLGARPLLAKVHVLLGAALRLSANLADATREYRNSLQVMDEMRKDAGDKFMDRGDVKAMFSEATRWSQASKS